MIRVWVIVKEPFMVIIEPFMVIIDPFNGSVCTINIGNTDIDGGFLNNPFTDIQLMVYLIE